MSVGDSTSSSVTDSCVGNIDGSGRIGELVVVGVFTGSCSEGENDILEGDIVCFVGCDVFNATETGTWLTGTLDALSDKVGISLKNVEVGKFETMDEGDDVDRVGDCDMGLIVTCVGINVGSGFTGVATGTGIEDGIDIEIIADMEKGTDAVGMELSPRRRFHPAIFW
jgi:hypothetical protein